MLIATELNKLRHEIESKASRKEVYFFYFIMGRPLKYPEGEILSEIEEICLSTYCDNAKIKSDLVSNLRHTKPIRGMHYSNNLIELSAVALYDSIAESGNINLYCNNASIRDIYVLRKLFAYECQLLPESKNKIDDIAKALLFNEEIEDWERLLIHAIYEVKDLIDVFIVYEGYTKALKIYSIEDQIIDIKLLIHSLENVNSRITRKIHWRFNIYLSILLIVVFVPLAYFVMKNWSKAEPILYLGTTLIFLLSAFMPFIFNKKFDKIHILRGLRERMVNKELNKQGVNYQELKSIMSKYEKQNIDI